MEDASIEIQPHTSPESPLSVRITVTVASAAPATTKTPSPPPADWNSLALALPVQRSGGFSGSGGGREDCWSEEATSVLIDAWGERYMELSRGNLKQKHWQEVADIVSSRVDYMKPPKTDVQCKNRIDTVKKKYKTEKSKVSGGSGPSRWPFYDCLDRLIGPTAISKAGAVPVGIPVGVRTLPVHMSHNFPFMQSNFASPVYQKLDNTIIINNNNDHEHFRRGLPIPPPDSDSEAEEGWSRDMDDSFPPETHQKEGWSRDMDDSFPPETPFDGRKRARVENSKGKGKRGNWGDSIREVTRAILKFGEAYESAESAKLRQIVEMEEQRMKFAKEMELQRIKFLMKTQLEISQLNENSNSIGNNHNHNNVNHANSEISN